CRSWAEERRAGRQPWRETADAKGWPASKAAVGLSAVSAASRRKKFHPVRAALTVYLRLLLSYLCTMFAHRSLAWSQALDKRRLFLKKIPQIRSLAACRASTRRPIARDIACSWPKSRVAFSVLVA